MKAILLSLSLFVIVSTAAAQELGQVIIRNADKSYPSFIASLNGVRLSNDYTSAAIFNYLEDNNYRVKILQAGSVRALNFTLNSAPNYVSRYLINRDAYGNFSLVLESKSLMNSQGEALINASNTVATPVIPAGDAETATTSTIVVPQPMQDAHYNDMLNSVKKESIESTKLEMAKTFFGDQNLTSIQVAGILKCFAFESTRLSFAKFAYSRTIDQPNYYRVYDAFSFSSSKKEMSEYIKNKK